METEHNIEQLFREGLAGHRKTPPDHLWQRIAAGTGVPAPPLNGKNGTRKGLWWWIPISLIVLLLVGGLILLNSSPEKPAEHLMATSPVVAAQETTLSASVSSDPMVSTSNNKTNVVAPAVITTPACTASGMEDQLIVSQIPANHQTDIAYAINTSTLTEVKISEESITTSSEQSTPLEVTQEVTAPVTAEPPTPIIVGEKTDVEVIQVPIEEVETLEQSTKNNTPATVKILDKKRFPDFPALGLALHGGPFLYQTFNPYPEEFRVASDHLLSLEMKYRRISIITGAGIFKVTDKTPWTGQRMQLDTVGYYQYVTGVTFLPVYHPIDSTIVGYTTGNMTMMNTPAVDTTYHPVWFTAHHRYTYLTLPVIVGYDVWNRNKLTAMVHAGVIYNLKVFDVQRLPREAREPMMVSMEQQGLIRKEQLWQYQAGLGLRYDLQGAWYTGAELAVRRNLTGWYQESPGSHPIPTSILLRATVGIWL
jgi:hypothetical protein